MQEGLSFIELLRHDLALIHCHDGRPAGVRFSMPDVIDKQRGRESNQGHAEQRPRATNASSPARCFERASGFGRRRHQPAMMWSARQIVRRGTQMNRHRHQSE